MKPNKVIRYFDTQGNTRNCLRNSEKAEELHTCPYREDINGDYLTLCDCNADQTQQCAEDI